MTCSTSFFPTPRLLPGQSLQLALDAGTVLQVVAGTLTVHEPMRWVGDTVLRPAVRLCEGQGHRLAQAGWCVLAAEGEAAEWRCHAPRPRPSVWSVFRGAAWRRSQGMAPLR